jgi:drug/metabolite transporter, DME family
VRVLVAAVVLMLAYVTTRPARNRLSWRVVFAGVCLAAYQVCFFSAVPLAGVAVTALLAICIAPVLVGVIARLALNEELSTAGLLAMATGVIGAGLLVGGGSTRLDPSFLPGCSLALAAGLAYSFYVVATKSVVGQSPPLGVAAISFSVAALMLLPLLVAQPAATAHAVTRAWPFLLYLGTVPTAGAYALYTAGLRRTPAAVAALVGLLEPLTAACLGLALLHEQLAVAQVLGAALLVSSMALIGAASRRPPAMSATRFLRRPNADEHETTNRNRPDQSEDSHQ